MVKSVDPSPSRSLTAKTTEGFAWMFGQSLIGKLIRFAGQIVLAWLLLPESWGLISLTYTIVMLCEQISSTGVRQVLVHRQASYRRWSNAAVWLSTTLGFASAALMLAAARPAAALYEVPEVVGLVQLLAVVTPIRALATVPEARMQIDLRFRLLAGAIMIQTIIITLLTVLFAWMGFGAYSFVWPQIIFHVARTAVFWTVAPAPVRWAPQLRRWRYLFGDSLKILIADLFNSLAAMAAPMVLGIFHTPEVVGLYYFSVNLSVQTVRQVTLNLRAVLFPALARIQDDPVRQIAAFLRASRMMAIVALPLCFLQAALAEPFTHLLLSEKWVPAIPLMQILSLGAAGRLISHPSLSLLQAQGRFGLYLLVAAGWAAGILAVVAACAAFGGATAVAIGVASCFVVLTPIECYVAIRPGGGGWLKVLLIFAAPALVSAVAVGGGTALALLVPPVSGQDVLRIAIILVVSGSVYVPLIRLVRPQETRELADRFRSLLPARRARHVAAAK